MTGIDCFVPIEDPTLKLEGILAMNLHDHSSDVEEVTDRALKEANMEDSLEKLTHTWKDPGRMFWIVEKFKVVHGCMRCGPPAALGLFVYQEGPRYDGVYTIRLSNEDVDQLESDQVLIQSMVSSRYLVSFEYEVDGSLVLLAIKVTPSLRCCCCC